MTRSHLRGLVSTLALGVALVYTQRADAQTLPSGATVTRGTVTVGTPNGGTLQIDQSSARAIVNWNTFDIGTGGTVTINQPDRSSALLNRVTGSQGSQIDGRISSNGQVFLVNPNGVAIGSNGVVDTRGGFVASTLGIGDDDFMAERLNFSGSTAAGRVTNAGRIGADGGFVALIGTSVRNTGTITANMGRVALGAATSATLDLNGDGYLQVVLPTDASNAAGSPLIDQRGTIVANGGRIRIKASVAADAVRRAVNLNGTIEANSLNGVNGDVLLQTVGGGDIVGEIYYGDLTDPFGPTPLVVGSVRATNGTVRLDAAGSVRLDGTQIDAATIGVTADHDVVLSKVTAEAQGGLIQIGRTVRDGAATGQQSARLADTVTIEGLTTSLVAYGGKVDIAARNTVALGGLSLGEYDRSSLAISSRGSITGLDSLVYDRIDQLFIGAPAISIRNQASGMDGSTVVIDRTRLEAPRSMTLEAGDALDVRDGMSLLNVSTTLRAGRSLILNGAFVQQDMGSLDIAANVADANGGGQRGAGPALLDASGAQFTTVVGQYAPGLGDLSFRLLPGSDGGAGGLLKLGTIDRQPATHDKAPAFGNLSIIAAPAGQIVFYGDVNTYVTPNSTTNPLWWVVQNSFTLSGPIAFRNSATITAPDGNFYWLDQGARPITTYADGRTGFAATYSFRTCANGNCQVMGDIGGGGDASQLPQGGTVTAGTAGLSIQNGAMIVSQASDRAVIDWTSFNIGTGRAVTFNQPGTTSEILNRVSASAGVSTIAGALDSNGRVFLVNPNGVVITGDGSVSAVGGFIASSLPLANDAFMAGLRNWGANPTAGGISNAGTITASDAQVALLGGSIGNTGTIASGTIGSVSLIASGTGTIGIGQVSGGSLRLGARDITIGAAAGSSTLHLTSADTIGLLSHFNDVSIEAGNDLTIVNGLSVGIGTLSSLSFGAGRNLTVGGALRTGGTALTLTANSGSAALGLSGARGTGAATLDVSGATLGSTGAIGLALASGSEVAGGLIELAPTATTGSLSIDAAIGGAIRFGGNVTVGGTLSLVGSLQFAANSVVSGTILSWSNAPDDTVSGVGNGTAGFSATATLLSGGTTLFRGILGDSFAPRVALDGFAVGRVGMVYGDEARLNPGTAVRLTSGTLLGTDTLASLLAPGSLVLGGLGSGRQAAGAHTLTLGAPNGMDAIVGKAGYFYDLRLPATGGFTITPKPITWAVAGVHSMYGTTAAVSASLSGVLAGDSVSGTIAGFAGTTPVALSDRLGVGSYALTVTGLAGAAAGNYLLATSGNTAGSLTVAPLAIAAKAADVNSVYGTAAVLGAATLTGALAGDEVRAAAIPATSGAAWTPGDRLAVGRYAITVAGLTGAAAANYALGGVVGGTLTVDPKQLALSLTSGSYTYGSPVAVAALGGILSGDTLGLSGTLNGVATTLSGTANALMLGDRTAAGAYQLAVTGLTGAAATNYTFGGTTSASLTITPRPLGLSLTGRDYTYGSPSGLAALTGVLSGDALGLAATLDGLSTTLSGAPDALALSARTAAGTHRLAVTGLTGASAGNYALASTSPAQAVDFRIARKSITYETDLTFGTYGDFAGLTGAGGGIHVNGIVDGDDAIGIGAVDTGAGLVAVDRHTSAGSWNLQALLGGSSAGNYLLSATGNTVGRLTLAKRHITASIGTVQSTYGSLADLTVTLNNVVAGDDVRGVGTLLNDAGYARSFDERLAVGTYRVTSDQTYSPTTGWSNPLSGSAAGNYIFGSGSDGVLTVSPKAISAVLTGSTYAYGSPTATIALSGMLSGDTLTPSALLDGSATAITATAGGYALDARVAAGTHAIDVAGISGTNASNYVLVAGPGATVTITPRPLTWAVADISSIYGNLVTPVASFGNLLPGDGFGATFLIDGAAPTATPRVGTYATGVGGLVGANASNYMLATTGNRTGQLAITPRPVTYVLGQQTSTYGERAALSLGFANTLAGDMLTGSDAITVAQGGAAVTLSDRSNAGVYQLGYTGGLAGPDAGNYTLAGGSGGTLTIGKRVIALTPDDIGTVYGVSATPTGTFAGVLPGDQLTPVIARYAFDQTSPIATILDAGSYTIGGVGMTGASAVNYQLDRVRTATLTVTPRPITLTIDSQRSTYGSAFATTAWAAGLAGVLAGDRDAVTASATVVSAGTWSPAPLDAGTYTIAAGGLQGGKAGNYVLAPGGSRTATLTVDPFLIGTIGNLSTIYGNLAGIGGIGLTSAIAGLSADRVLLAQGQAINYRTTTAVGNYQIGLANLLFNGQPAGNYAIDPNRRAALTIRPRTVFMGGTTSYVYGTVGETATLDPYDANQFVAGDDARFVMTLKSLSASGMANAGSYSGMARLAGSSASNYLFNPTSLGNVQITRRALAATVNGTTTRAYGDPGDFIASLAGVVAGDPVGLATAFSDGADINAARQFPGSYGIFGHLTGAAAGNYSLTSDRLDTITITKRPVWFAPAGLTQSYGGFVTPALVNVLTGDTVGATARLLELDGTTAAPSGAPVGQYKLSGALTNSTAYYVLQAPGGSQTFDFTITPRVLDFTGSVSLTYANQASNAALRGLFGGLLSQDLDRIAPTYVGLNGSAGISQDAHPDAGRYSLAIGSLGGLAGGNYVLGANAATLTVTPLTINWRLGGTGTYGDALGSSDLATDRQLVGKENQSFGIRTGLVGSLINLPLAHAGDVGLGATIVGSNARVGQFTDAGTYQLAAPILTGASASNFQLAATPFSAATPLVILPRAISFSATGGTGAYAGLNTAPTASVALNGVLNGDDIRPILGFKTRAGDLVGQFSVGTYYAAAIGLSGTKAGNYRAVDWRQAASDGSISAMVASTITPRSLSIAPPSRFAFGDTLDLSSLLSGLDAQLAATDNIGLGVRLASGGTSAVSALDAGTYTAQYQLSGGLSGNYQLTSAGSAARAITITPRPIGYSIGVATSVYGETPTFSATLTNTLAGRGTPLLAIATTPESAATTALAQAGQLDAGSYFARVTGLSGEKSSNYLFQPVTPTTGATTIVPRVVTFDQAMTSIYGDIPVSSTGFSARSGVTGLVNGDVLTATAALSGGAIGTLKVGDRSYDTLTFGGARLSNYAIMPIGSKTLTVTPRTLTYQLFSGAVYGDGSAIATLGNVVNGDSVQPIVGSSENMAGGGSVGTEIGGAVSGVTTYTNPYREVGTYQYALYGLVGADAANYALPFRTGSMKAVDFTITPRPITPSQILASGTYGSTFQPVGWNNVLPGDDIGGKLDPIVATLSTGVPAFTSGRVFGADPNGALVKLDVGSYQFRVTGMTGSRSANYTFVEPLTFTLAITPAPFVFSLDARDRYYGNQIEACDAKGDCAMQANGRAFYTRGSQRFSSDDVNAVVTLTDARGTVYSYTPSGSTFTYNAGLNAGTYAISAASLFGAQAKNYSIPADYTKTLTIKPAVVGYRIDAGAGFYFKGLGYFGALPSVALNGVYGADQVSVTYGIFAGKDINSADPKLFYANASDLPVGLNHLQATGLVASPNYVLRQAGGAWGAGALETVNDASFFNLPLVGLDLGGTDPSKPATSTSSVLASVVGGSKAPPTGVTATAMASGSTQQIVGLGNGVNLISSASGSVEATATVGATGIKAAVGANFNVNETIAYGPGYTTIGAEGAAASSFSLSPTGLTTKNSAVLQAYQVQGVSGRLGNGVDGTLSAKVTEGMRAEANQALGYSDGQLTMKTKMAAGVGVSVGVDSGISGSLGSVSAGATVYSPGMVAAGFEPSVGYSDGKINVKFSLTTAIGIGGIDISLGGAIDVGVFEDAGRAIADGITDFFTGACNSDCKADQYVDTFKGLDPLANSAQIIAALTPGTSPLSSDQLKHVLGGWMASDLLDTAKRAEAAKATIAAEAKRQEALVTKMLSNPGAFTAADYAAIQAAPGSFAKTLADANASVQSTDQSNRYKFVVSNGQLKTEKAPSKSREQLRFEAWFK